MTSDCNTKDSVLSYVGVKLDVTKDMVCVPGQSRFASIAYDQMVDLLDDLGFSVEHDADGKHVVSKGWWS